jgi:hypothetical protein
MTRVTLTTRKPALLVVFELFHDVLMHVLKSLQLALQLRHALFELRLLFFLLTGLGLLLLLRFDELIVLLDRHVNV